MNRPQTTEAAIIFVLLIIALIYFIYRVGKMKNELKKSQERQALFFQGSHAIMLIIDPSNGMIVDANEAACRFYGYKREDIINMNINQINTLESSEIKSRIQSSLHRVCTRYSFRHRLADGTIRDVDVLSGPITMSGKLLLYSIITDVTERNIQESLRDVLDEISKLCIDSTDLQELFNKSIEIVEKIDGISGCGISILNYENNSLESRASTSMPKELFERMFCKSIMDKLIEIAVKGNICYFENSDQSQGLLKHFSEFGVKSLGIMPVMKNGIVVGTLSVASSHLSEFPESTKQILKWIAYDIGNAFFRLSSEAYKDELEDRWKFALEENGDIIIDIDFLSGKTYVSEYLSQVLGYSFKSDLDIMRDWDSLIHKEDLLALEKAMDEHKQGKLDKVLLELRIKSLDGRYKWFLCRGKEIKRNEKNRATRVIATLMEITYLKNYEQELLNSKQEAETSNKVKDLFLANISHELRTPMNGIIGMAQLLELSGLSEEQQESIDILSDSGRRMMQLINNLISFTSMETGEVALKEDSFDIESLISNVLSEYVKESRKKGLELISNIDKDLPVKVLGDSEKLSMIIKQLVDNSIKFTSNGRVQVTAKLASKETDSESIRICISVTDTGCGIKMEDQSKLFCSFDQVDNSYTRRYQGAGLGLAICKKMADILGAEIEVESTPEVGSIFTVIVCLRQEGTFLAKNEIKHIKGNILIADDDEVSRRLLGILCEKSLQKVQYAVNGREAVEKCLEDSFDLVFMDIQMPQLSGIEAARIIRDSELPGKARPFIIAVTAYALKSDRDRFISEGFEDYISKPVDTEQFVTIMNKWMAKRGTTKENN